MKSLAPLDFATSIAYLLPGFLAIFGLRYVSPQVRAMFSASFSEGGGFGLEVAILLFSLTAGIVVGAVRALLLDKVHALTGVRRPDLDYSKLKDKETRNAFKEVISNRYRFAQFYGNTLVALMFFGALRVASYDSPPLSRWVSVLLAGALLVLFVQHRRSLAETYTDLKKVLS